MSVESCQILNRLETFKSEPRGLKASCNHYFSVWWTDLQHTRILNVEYTRNISISLHYIRVCRGYNTFICNRSALSCFYNSTFFLPILQQKFKWTWNNYTISLQIYDLADHYATLDILDLWMFTRLASYQTISIIESVLSKWMEECIFTSGG